MKGLFELFFTFFKLGLFTFGGGYAMIPQIKEQVIEKKKWLSEEEVLEIIAISESTPGPIAINMATFIGYRQKKVLGSVCSTLGVVLPSLIIIYIISIRGFQLSGHILPGHKTQYLCIYHHQRFPLCQQGRATDQVLA